MSAGIYADHHVPSDVIRGLRLRHIDRLTAAEDGRRQVPDEVLLERATSLGRVLVSMDEDLLVITATWLATGQTFAGLIYGHQLSVSVGRMVVDIERIATKHSANELANRVFYLPL